MTNADVKPVPGAVLDGPIAEMRERTLRLLYETAEHIGGIQPDGPADRKRLIEAADDLREMFLMVTIIGEFNAGKSTFVNALLGEAILPMGITPTTDMIELIRYAATPGTKPTIKGDGSVREWTHPNTGSAGVAIVDTPGTGSVFQKHEEIAKSFLHRSDLVIFLLSAKRAFAETERLYLELAKNYGKKIIVVINQSDLLEARELNEVQKFVQQQIDQLLNLRPPIFMVSAKKALQQAKPGGLLANLAASLGRETTTDRDDHGMLGIRQYLRTVFESVPPARQKIQTRLELLKSVVTRHRDAIQSRIALIGADTDAAESLRKEIEAQAAGLELQLKSAMDEAHHILTTVSDRGAMFVEKNINVVRATLRGFDKEKLANEFERDVLGDTLTRLTSAQEHYVNALVDGSRQYWRGVIERLNKLEVLLKDEAAGMDAATYADQRAALQTALTMANVEMKAYSDKQVIQSIQNDFAQNVRSFTYSAIGSFGGIVAVILSAAGAAAPGALPPLAALGLIFGVPFAVGGGVVAVLIWRRAVGNARKQLDGRIHELEMSYQQALTKLTTDERNRLVQYGKQILSPVFSQLSALAERYRNQQAQLDQYTARGVEIDRTLAKLDAASGVPIL